MKANVECVCECSAQRFVFVSQSLQTNRKLVLTNASAARVQVRRFRYVSGVSRTKERNRQKTFQVSLFAGRVIKRVFGNGCGAVQRFSGRRIVGVSTKQMSAPQSTFSTAMKNVVLVCCGSFNPVTKTHLLMFNLAKQYLEQECSVPHKVVAGIISPVNDKYSHKKLTDSHHRIQMIRMALSASNCSWIQVDDFESRQLQWMRTVQVLRHIESNIKTSIFQKNLNICNDEISVKLLCGADLIETFLVPNLWQDSDIEELTNKYGLVIVPRKGWNPEKFINEHKILSRFCENIIVVKTWSGDDVSATRVRNALERGEYVGDLVESSVLEYIKKYNLYSST